MESIRRHCVPVLIALIFLLTPSTIKCEQNDAKLWTSKHDLLIIKDKNEQFTVHLYGKIEQPTNLTFQVQHDGVLQVAPNHIELKPDNGNTNYTVVVFGNSPGHVEINAAITPTNANINIKDVYVRVIVAISSTLISISSVIGWFYFVAWSVSFYPQIHTNYRRKSVIGLNFDFVSLNIVGFTLYGIFNIGLYYSPYIQEEYFRRFPRGANPVQLNDIFFAVHAMIATAVTIIQCFIYERGEQRVSTVARSLLTVFAICLVIFGILSATNVVHWLDFLYVCSYIKLCITLIKYVPQAVMNYRRKSTVGWSIGNVMLDFTGGILSMLQMILNAHNYDDWVSIFGDPTKFGLGLFSVMFDILFLVQHYFLYRNLQPYAEIGGTNSENADTVDDTVTES